MSISGQRDYILKYLKDNNYNFVCEYVDDGFSGTRFDRPELEKMLEDIKQKKINMVVTKDLSRLGRDNGKMSLLIDDFFITNNVRYIAINDGYDSFTENTAKEMAWVTNGINEMYCRDISKKVRTGLRMRKEKGLFTGWKAIYGYTRDIQNYNKLVVDFDASQVVKRIFKLAYSGKSATQIADILSKDKIPNPSTYANLKRAYKTSSSNLWCARTIGEMLINETYIGNLTQGMRKKVSYKLKKEIRTSKNEWIVVENTHEPIIDKKIFDCVQKMFNKNKNKTSNTNIQLLSGFIYCKECGHAITITKSMDNKRFYCGCSFYRKYSKHGLCTPHTINYKKLEEAVLNSIRENCKKQLDKIKLVEKASHKNINDKNQETSIIISGYKQKIQMIENAIDNTYIDMVKGVIDIDRYKSVSSKLNNELIQYKSSLKELNEQTEVLKHKGEVKHDYLAIINGFLKFENPPRQLLANLLDKVYLSENKSIEIVYNFVNI